jgi:uncharacterized protein
VQNVKSADLKQAEAAIKSGDFAQARKLIGDQPALELLQQLADGKDICAQHSLALLHYKGDILQQDFPKAIEWFTKAAEGGHARAQLNLGLAYSRGEIVVTNHKEAGRWFKAAADQGLSLAQYNLALLHVKGSGVEQSYTEAARLFERAAAQGDADACYQLAMQHEKGWGFEVNASKALEYYQKAADQGVTDAISQIARLNEASPRISSRKGSNSSGTDKPDATADSATLKAAIEMMQKARGLEDDFMNRDQARDLMKQAHQLVPDNLQIKFWYGAILARGTTLSAEAIKLMEPYVMRGEADIDDKLRLVTAYFNNRDFDRCIDLCLRINAETPHPEAFRWMGRAYHTSARGALAVDAFREVIKFPDANTRYTRLELADALNEESNYAEAISIYQQLLTETPGNSDAVYGLMECLMKMGEPHEAKKFHDEMVSAYPDLKQELARLRRALPRSITKK